MNFPFIEYVNWKWFKFGKNMQIVMWKFVKKWPYLVFEYAQSFEIEKTTCRLAWKNARLQCTTMAHVAIKLWPNFISDIWWSSMKINKRSMDFATWVIVFLPNKLTFSVEDEWLIWIFNLRPFWLFLIYEMVKIFVFFFILNYTF